MFTVDGITWAMPCDITRQSEIKISDISGMMMNGVQWNDVLGTYATYEITLTPNPHAMGEYYQLYAVLNDPAPYHTFTLPFDNSTIELVGMVGQLRDVYIRMGENQPPYWKGLRFTVAGTGPYKENTLEQAIARGLPPLPPVNTAQIGDTYQWTSNGWVETSGLPNAELMAFPRGS